MSRLALVLMVCVLAGFSVETLAASPAIGLDAIGDTYRGLQDTWFYRVKTSADRLFWLLVAVDFAWSGVTYVLEKNDIGEIAISMVKKMLTIGFFWSLLQFSHTWIPAIIDSFRQIGQTAGGATASTPDGIIAVGFELASGAFSAVKQLGAFEAIAVVLPVTAISIIIFLSYVFIAAQLLVTLVESYIAIGAGVILLGFGGSRWTTDFATKYLQFAVGTGMKLMMIYMIVGAGQSITDSLTVSQSDLVGSLLRAGGVSLVYAYLAIQIPAIASAMMSGSPSMTAGAMASTALTMGAAVAGGAAAAGAAAMGAGAVGSGGMVGAGGLAKALGAGMQSAADLGLTGAAGAMHAVGEVAGHGMGMTREGIGSAVAGGAQSFGQAVSGSTGGQIADRIQGGRGGSMSGANGPSLPAPPAASGAAGGSAPAQGTPQASSASSSGSSSSAPASSSGAAPQGATDSPLGDASNVSFDSGNAAGNTQSQPTSSNSEKMPAHAKIRDLQGFVPQDAAQGAAIQINLGHTQD